MIKNLEDSNACGEGVAGRRLAPLLERQIVIVLLSASGSPIS